MAGRTISTKLVIEGESEYKKKLSEINANLGELKTRLNDVKSATAETANSEAALTQKVAALEKIQAVCTQKVEQARAAFEAAKAAQQKYAAEVETCRTRLEEAQRAEEALKSSVAADAKAREEAAKATAAAQKALEDAERVSQQANNTVVSYAGKLTAAQREQARFDTELRNNKKYLDEAKNSTDKCATSIDQYGKKTGAAERQTRQNEQAVQALAQALAGAGLKMALSEIVDAINACIDASVKFESAMAGVRRTVGGSDEEIAAMGKAFQDMSLEMPITTEELAKIAQTAGQLGIQRDQVEEFTRIMAMLGTTTDLTAENAATLLAQFANITGLEDYERLGATVAELGDATATTATKVVEMSQGMAAAADIAGFSETDILAVSAAVGSLGIEAQAGSTAMSVLISTLYKATETGGDKLEQFAAVAGMSGTEFAQAWKKDAAGAFASFVEGLSQNEQSAVVLLEELGITNVRQTKAILGLSNAGDLLRETIGQANRAWEENSALTEKASIMYETTEAKVQMLKSSFEQVKVAAGDELTPVLGGVAEAGTDAFAWAADVIEQCPWLVDLLAGLTIGVGALATGVGVYTAVKAAATPVMLAFNAALKACPAIFVASAIIGVVAALTAFIAKLKQAKGETEETGDAMEGTADGAEETEKAMEEAAQAAEDTARAMEDAADAAGETADAMVETGDTVEETADRFAVLNQVMQVNEQYCKLLGKAQKECTDEGYLSLDMVNKLISSGLEEYLEETAEGYRLTEGALEDYLSAQRRQYELIYADAENAAAKVVNTEAVKRAGLDATTASIRSQLEATKALYRLKADEAAEVYGENVMAAANDPTYRRFNRLASEAQKAISTLDEAQRKIDDFDRAAATMGRDYGGSSGSSSQKSGGSKSAEKTKTAAEIQLEAWKAGVAELDHLRALDLLSEEDYYKRKGELAEAYLADNREERWAWDEELYSYNKQRAETEAQEQAEALKRAQELKKDAYSKALDELDYLRDMDIIDEEEYWREFLALRDRYFEEGSEEWKSATVKLYDHLKDTRDASVKELESANQEELKAQKEAMEESLKEAQAGRDEDLRQLKDWLKERQTALKEGYKEEYEQRKAAIDDELAQEQKRLNAKLDAIDDELTARKRLREDEEQDDAVSAAQKRLTAAQAQRAYARTAEDAHEWDQEILRLQEALKEAIRAKEDTAFEREKQAQKEVIQLQLTQAKEEAQQAKEDAKADYDAALKAIEDGRDAAMEGLQAQYDQMVAMTEEGYERTATRLQEEYEASVERLEAEYSAAVERLMVDRQALLSTPAAGSDVLAMGLGPLSSAAAGVVQRAASFATSYSQSTDSRSYGFTMNNYAAPMSEGRYLNAVRKMMEEMSR